MRNFNSGNFVDRSCFRSFEPGLIDREYLVESEEVKKIVDQVDKLLKELNGRIGELEENSDTSMGSFPATLESLVEKLLSQEARACFMIENSGFLEGSELASEAGGVESEAMGGVASEEVSEMTNEVTREVANCLNAIKLSIIEIEKLPISARLIRNLHRHFLEGTKEANKQPGEFRDSQSWGDVGSILIDESEPISCNIDRSIPDEWRFVPPVEASIKRLISDLENFIHNDKNTLDPLLKLAILYYQLETIQPFLVSNGKVARMLILLYLLDNQLLKAPLLAISVQFMKEAQLYKKAIRGVREHNDLEGWVLFFLKMLGEATRESIATLSKTDILRDPITGTACV